MIKRNISNLRFAIYVLTALCLSASLGVAQGGPTGTSSLPSAPPTIVTPPPLSSANSLTDDGDDYVDPPAIRTQGVLVQTLDGRAVMEQAADQAFNPASAIKLATALAALRNLGPRHRFSTAIWTDGEFNRATATIEGDLIVSGRDPSFHYQHAILIARELNRAGIRTVTGDLIVAPYFTMNFSQSALRSGENLYDTLDAPRRPAAAVRAWMEEQRLTVVRQMPSVPEPPPSVAVMGAVYVGSVPPGARMLLTHRSSELVDILKVLLCYSNNFMAERLGDTLGGVDALERFLVSTVGINPWEVHIASTSGLGTGRITPRAMMKVYRALLAELAHHKLSPSDIMPVAGVDPGTLQKRYTFYPARGSVIAKTGTLPRTDGGASALVGQMRARDGGTLLFVIFNQRGNVVRFRREQDRLVSDLQNLRGGPVPFNYTPLALAMRLADTELNAPRATATDEYEPAAN